MNLSFIRITLRRLRKNILISIIHLLGLSLGVACAYLSIYYYWQENQYDRKFRDSDRINRVGVDFMNMGGFAVGPEYLSDFLMGKYGEIEDFCRISPQGNILLKEDQNSVLVEVMAVDSSFFNLFDFPLLHGSSYTVLRQPDQAAISAGFARRWFGRENVIGENIEIPLGQEKKNYSVVAVFENSRNYTHLKGDILIPVAPYLQGDRAWYSAAYYTYFKLKEGVLLAEFEKILENIREHEIYSEYGKSSGLSYPEWKQKPEAFRFLVQPLEDIYLYSKLNFELSAGGNAQRVKIFLLIGGLILLIAVANYINISTARYSERLKEIGVKRTVGFSRRILIRQFLSESLVESIFIILGAILLMRLFLDLFEWWTGDQMILPGKLNWLSMVLFALFTVLICLLAALYPAIFLSKIKPLSLMKRSDGGLQKNILRRVLVIFQFFITSALICATLVIFSQLVFMNDKDLGFHKEELLVIENMENLGAAAFTFRDRIDNHPMVMNTSFARSMPGSSSIFQATYKTPQMDQSIPIRMFPVDNRFLSTMGIRLIEGSDFLPGPTPDSTVAIINESAMKSLGLTNPIGAEISRGKRVIGVVGDFHIESLRHGIQPVVLEQSSGGYFLAVQIAPEGMSSVQSLIREMEAELKLLKPDQTLQYSFMDESFQKMLTQEILAGKGTLALTVIAVFTASLGLFGLTVFTVKRREKEIGIHKVLGASVFRVLRYITGEFLGLVLISLVLAIPFSWYLMRLWLDDFAYQIPLAWWYFALTSCISLLVALLTVGIQSLKSAWLNPAEILKQE